MQGNLVYSSTVLVRYPPCLPLRSQDGRTALWIASAKGHVPVVTQLLSAPGTAINAANEVITENCGHCLIKRSTRSDHLDQNSKHQNFLQCTGSASNKLADDKTVATHGTSQVLHCSTAFQKGVQYRAVLNSVLYCTVHN
jgi:ankyrin repeat protein